MKIYDGLDKAKEEGFESYRDRLRYLPDKFKNPFASMPRWNGKVAGGGPVRARVDFGLWVADCECGGCEAVTPKDPIFFCFSCGNKRAKGEARPVLFPKNRGAIEKELLERPIVEFAGSTPIQLARLSRPELPMLSRSWNPGETIKDLRDQHKAAKLYEKTKDGI